MRFSNFLFILLIGTITLVSCKSETKKEQPTQSEIKTGIVTSIENPVSGNSSLPRLFGTPDQLFMSWVEKKDTVSVLYYSSLKDGNWGEAVEVNSGIDWFVNWADFPTISVNDGNILTSYLQKSATGKYTYDVKLNLFSAETQTWKKNILLNEDGTQSEHGFVSAVPNGDSSFYVIWLDGRNTAGGHENHKMDGTGAMTLRGRLVNADGTMEPDVVLDNRVCDCCQTGMTTIDDAPVIVYRDRSETEIRDISRIGLFDDSFSEPKTVFKDNWKINGCPVNGPAIASFKNKVAVAWFTGVNENPKVQVVFSNDGGKNFGKPIQINIYETLGRVDIAMISEENAVVSWMENIGKETLIQVMRVSADGTKGFPVTVSKTTAARTSGFPQLEVVRATVYLAWTSVEGEKSTIKTASISSTEL